MIRIGRDIQCLPYAGFLEEKVKEEKNFFEAVTKIATSVKVYIVCDFANFLSLRQKLKRGLLNYCVYNKYQYHS